MAQPALEQLIGNQDGESGHSEGSITDFRYQVRLAIGSHFAKFTLLLLPFYVGLKVWWFLASVFVGSLFGYIYLYAVYYSRRRFSTHLGAVALLASAYLSFTSAYMFMKGMVSTKMKMQQVYEQ